MVMGLRVMGARKREGRLSNRQTQASRQVAAGTQDARTPFAFRVMVNNNRHAGGVMELFLIHQHESIMDKKRLFNQFRYYTHWTRGGLMGR